MRYGEPQFIFGEMLKAAVTRVKAFHSDLYHDAIAIHQRILPVEPGTGYVGMPHPFLWFVGDMGTHLYWLDKASCYPSTVESIATTCPAIYFYDGYTIAPIGLVDAISAVKAGYSLRNEYRK